MTFEGPIRRAVLERDEHTVTVGLMRTEDGSAAGIRLGRPVVGPEPQDSRRGLDSYRIACGAGREHYGGVRQVSITRSRLQVLLDEEAAAALGVHQVSGWDLLLSDEDYQRVIVDGLREVLEYGDPARTPQITVHPE